MVEIEAVGAVSEAIEVVSEVEAEADTSQIMALQHKSSVCICFEYTGKFIVLTELTQKWAPSSTQPKANSSAAASIQRSHTSTHPYTSRTRLQSAKLTRFSVL